MTPSKLILALSTSTAMSLTTLADPINLTTDASQMSFNVESSGKVIRTYYGSKLANSDDARAQSNTRSMAYPSVWDTKMGEAAVSITQSDGKVSLDLVHDSHELTEPGDGQKLLVINMKDTHYPVRVRLSVLAHQDSNVYEQWVEIFNDGQEAVSVDQAASGHLLLDGSSYHVTSFRGTWAGESLMREEEVLKGNLLEVASFSGTRTAQEGSPAFVISPNGSAQEDSGDIYMGALAWSGNYRLRYKHNTNNYGSGGTLMATFGADMLQSPYRLDAGKSLTLPRLILTYSNEGKGKASRQIHQWARKHGIKGGDQERLTLLNSWEGAYFSFTEEMLHTMMERTAGMGIELFVLDDGWFANKYPRNNSNAGLGDWDVNTKKLPNGIEGLTKAAKDRNVKFGIWVELEMVNPKSELYEKHPEWAIQLPYREERLERGQLVLDLANPDVQQYIITCLDKLLGDNPEIVYIKWDCNRAISNPGSTYLDKDHQKNLFVDYVNGYYHVMKTITDKYPKVVFQDCGSGGGRADYGAMKYHHEFWVSDNTDPYDRIFMQWGIGHVFPAISMASHVTVSPNHQTQRETPLKFRFDVAMSARFGFELQPQKLTDAEVEFCKKGVEEYKRIRPVVQFGDLYRLRSPYESETPALMYVHNDGGKQHAVVFTYVLNKLYADSAAPVKLKGLKRDKTYSVKEINLDDKGTRTSLHDKNVGGDYLMDHGIKLRWNRTLQSSVIEVTEV